MKLPKSLIKKYGITKKAWSVYRSRKRSGSTRPKRRPKKVRSMPRRRYRSKARKKSYRKVASKSLGIFAPMIYGGIRAKGSQMVAPLTQSLPLGSVADEGAMLIANYALDKVIGSKVPQIRPILKAGRHIEWAMIGGAIASGQLNLGIFSGGGNGGGGAIDVG